MDRQELLRKLAVELAEWPSRISEMRFPMSSGWQALIEGGHACPIEVVAWSAAHGKITKSNWLAERQRLIAKPQAPEWPQVGNVAEVHNDGYGISYGGDVLGEEVEVKALFMSGDIHVAAVEHDGQCFCFRVDMLRPIRSEEDQAKDAIAQEVLAAMDNGLGSCFKDVQIATVLYAAIRDGKIPGVKLEA